MCCHGASSSFNDYLILGNTMMTVLTATQYRKSLDTDTFLHTFKQPSLSVFCDAGLCSGATGSHQR